MRKICLTSLICLALCCGCATAQQSQLTSNSMPDDVLNALHDSGTNIKSFSASVKLNEFDNGTGAETNRFGKVWFQVKADGQPIMHIIFDQKQIGDKKPIPDKIEYLLDDGWVTDRTFATSTEARIQLVPKGQKVDLFRVGKSPFPMPIGQDPTEVQKQFDVSNQPPAKDDPTGTIHLLLKPKPGSPLDDRFFSIDIWTDLNTRMPVRIKTVDGKQVIERTTDLSNLKVNPALNPTDISIAKLPPDWRTSDTPLAN